MNESLLNYVGHKSKIVTTIYILSTLFLSADINAQTQSAVRQVQDHKLDTGEVYTGELVNGQPNGRGTLANSTGVITFNHNWVNGQPSGQGWIKFKNGIRISGRMNGDFSFSNATMKFTDGAEITGTRWKIIPEFDWTYAAVDDTAMVRLPDGKMIKVRFNMNAKKYEPVE